MFKEIAIVFSPLVSEFRDLHKEWKFARWSCYCTSLLVQVTTSVSEQQGWKPRTHASTQEDLQLRGRQIVNRIDSHSRSISSKINSMLPHSLSGDMEDSNKNEQLYNVLKAKLSWSCMLGARIF